MNGDGFSDVIVGADRYDNGQTDEGRAFVYLGSRGRARDRAAWTAESNQAGAHFGDSVATAGDVNGDGYSDVIVGAPGVRQRRDRRGPRVRLPRLGRRASVHDAAWTAESNQASALLRLLGRDRGRRQRRRLLPTSSSAPAATTTARPTRGAPSSTTARPPGLAPTPAWTAESDQADA